MVVWIAFDPHSIYKQWFAQLVFVYVISWGFVCQPILTDFIRALLN